MADRRAPSDRAGGMLPPVGARTPGLDDLHDDVGGDPASYDHGRHGAGGGRPNYLLRRVGAAAVAVAVVAVGAVLALRAIGGDDDGSGVGAIDDRWNSIVVLTDDEVRVLDADGEVLDTLDAPAPALLDAQAMVAGEVLVTMTDAGRISMVDLADGTATRGRASLDNVLRPSRGNPRIGVAGPEIGGDITLVDTVNREIVSVAEIAGLDDPLVFPDGVAVNAAGTHAAMADSRSFQSIVVDIQNETAELLAGQVTAIDDVQVVTAQRAGDETELEFHDLAGERTGSVDVPTPLAIMTTGEGRVLIVDAAGAVRTASAGGSVEDVVTLTDADGAPLVVEGGAPIAGGDRLLVLAEDHLAILDRDGAVVAVVDGELGSAVSASSRCVVAGGFTTTAPKRLIDVETGVELGAVESGVVGGGSLDGCTVGVIGTSSPTILGRDGTVPVDARTIGAIAPDGSAYTVIDGRDTELVRLADDGRVELFDEPGLVYFAQR